KFAQIAASMSDDSVTAQLGGSLGTQPATNLPPTILDLAASLQPGQVSAPVESRSGFRILKLDATPPNEILAARRIVIAYQACTGELRAGRTATRTRAQAFELAQQVVRQARNPGASFEQLVETYSDDVDA